MKHNVHEKLTYPAKLVCTELALHHLSRNGERVEIIYSINTFHNVFNFVKTRRDN